MSVTLPNKSQYSDVDILADGVTYYLNRAAYLAALNVQAPAFISGQPVKRWSVAGLDLTNPNAPYTYNSLGLESDGITPSVIPITITVGLAAIFNLPGTVIYQTYADWSTTGLAATGSAALFNFNGTLMQYAIDPQTLLLPALAMALAIEIGNGAMAVEQIPANFKYVDGDARRVMNISIGTNSYNAGYLFRSRNIQAGIGAPGTWAIASNGPVFTPSIQATGETSPSVPVPVRPLVIPPERLAVITFGAIAIQRTDMPPFNTVVTGGSGSLTIDQASAIALLPGMNDQVTAINTFLKGMKPA